MALPSPVTDLAEEIRTLIRDDDLSRATKRLLDYTKQFSGQRDVVNSAIVLTGELRSLQTDIRKFGNSQERRSQLNALAHRILEILDECETPPEACVLAGPPPHLRVTPIGQEKGDSLRPDLSTPSKAADRKRSLTRRERDFADFVKARNETSTALPTASAVEARGLRKNYRDFTLAGIDLTLDSGQIVGLIGVNGSGKTTLLGILSGVLAADGGDLSYPLLCPNGFDWVRIRSQIAYVQQNLPAWYGSLEDSLHLHAALHQLTGRANEEEVEFILHRLGLESYRKACWHEISGGFQMRFALAKALVGRPKLLILDEPLAPLDINTQQVFLQDLRDLANSSLNPLPIILSSQHIYEVEAIADSIIFLDRGEAVFSGSLDELYQTRQESTYEITAPESQGRIWEILEPLGVIEVEHTGITYLASVPSKVTGRDVLSRLLEANIDIRYFRDISNSSRKLFKGRGE